MLTSFSFFNFSLSCINGMLHHEVNDLIKKNYLHDKYLPTIYFDYLFLIIYTHKHVS